MRTFIIVPILAWATLAHATAEICGNDIDDNGDGAIDEGCAPTLSTGVCESPLSCGTTGMVSWANGALHYDLPPDVTPAVPYGPGIGLRRFYTSMYAPGSGGPASVDHTPMGDRWQHTYMVWIDRYTVGPDTKIVLHTSEGQDVFATHTSDDGTWEVYTPQPSFHVMSIEYNTASPNQYEVQLLTGETLYFNSVGQLTQIWDNLPTPNVVTVTWTGTSNANVSTVTDASGGRRLSFNYTSNLLTSVDYQLDYSGTWTTEHTTTYSYTSGVLMSVTIGSQLAQQYDYGSGYLTSISDGSGSLIADFHYSALDAGEVDGVDTPRGSVGFDYNTSRTACSGDTVLYFNKGSNTSCTTDADCGGLLCGGASSGSGMCYEAGRCLATESLNGETVVTYVSPLAPPEDPSGACDGACTDVAQYVWSSDPTLLNTIGVKDPLGSYTSATYNANGLPTEIAYGDTDSDPTDGGGAHVAYFLYDTTYPGRPAEMRHTSDHVVVGAGGCSLTSTVDCARTIYSYGSNTQLSSITKTGYTLGSNGTWGALSIETNYDHDAEGRLTEIDGPGSGMRTAMTYFTSSDPAENGFLQATQRYTTATAHLDTTVLAYDIWGNAVAKTAPDGTVSCRTYDSSRNYLTQSRTAMAGQSDCTSPDPSDLVWSYLRDSALRETRETRPDGGCVFREYDSLGRLSDIKRRDDCNASSAGDTQIYSYTLDSEVSEVDTYDGSAHLTRKQPFTYHQSRQLDEIVNPVDSTFKQVSYDQAGHISSVTDESSLGKTNVSYTADYQISEIDRYTTSTAYDSWTFADDFNDLQLTYEDGDSLTVSSLRDDAQRTVQLSSPDRATTIKVYDPVGGVVLTMENGLLWSTMTRDLLDRPLTADYTADSCGSGHEETWSYDSLPSGISCPITGGCNHTTGRLAYVKKSLTCSGAYADDSLDQETFYSYDPAGRVLEEYIRDDSGRVADQKYTWTKDGALASVTTPSTAVIGYTYGSSGNNSDSDRITALWQGSASTPVIDTVTWFPFGSLEQYNQEATISGTALRTVISQDLAARISNIQMQTTSAVEKEGVALTRDSKGRVTLRDYFDNSAGVQDSYFMYDEEDRVLCETTTSVASCPRAWGSGTKNSREILGVDKQYHAYTPAGDWYGAIRANDPFALIEPFALGSGTHQIHTVKEGATATLTYAYDTHGQRSSEAATGSGSLTHANRGYGYDGPHYLTEAAGLYYTGAQWDIYIVTSTFDAQGRRVSKSWEDIISGLTTLWFFYYDPLGRLVEVDYTPNTSVATTYSIFQIAWLGDRPVAFTQSDFPGPTVSKRYTVTDESDRIIALWSWPASGSASRVWAINPTAWGYDAPILGSTIYQPFSLAGQYRDPETATYNDSNQPFEPALSLAGARTYDPFTGSYLQVDPEVAATQSSYVVAKNNPVGTTATPYDSTCCVPAAIYEGVPVVVCGSISATGDQVGDYSSPPQPPKSSGIAVNATGIENRPISGLPDASLWVPRLPASDRPNIVGDYAPPNPYLPSPTPSGASGPPFVIGNCGIGPTYWRQKYYVEVNCSQPACNGAGSTSTTVTCTIESPPLVGISYVNEPGATDPAPDADQYTSMHPGDVSPMCGNSISGTTGANGEGGGHGTGGNGITPE